MYSVILELKQYNFSSFCTKYWNDWT